MSVEKPQLTLDDCRKRQERLREAVAAHDPQIKRVLVGTPEHVQWLTGFRPHWLMSAAAWIDLDGGCVLVAPNAEPDFHAADQVLTFEAQWQATLRQEQSTAISEVLFKALSPSGLREHTEIDILSCPAILATLFDKPAGIDRVLHQLRRKKEADELALIRKAIDCTDVMYRKAREIIEPGISELEVFTQLHAAAVHEAGEALSHPLGNDYQVNSPGGPARDGVVAEDGQLYILDLGPTYRGYFADNCRAFAVNGQPTDAQRRAWEAIVSVFDIVEETVKPGTSCRELYDRCKARLDDADPTGSFWHHLGHGIGLYPHEGPHLNPNWDDTFAEGDVFTVEPGIYTEALKAGIRLEENYRVTADGVEKLTKTPLDL